MRKAGNQEGGIRTPFLPSCIPYGNSPTIFQASIFQFLALPGAFQVRLRHWHLPIKNLGNAAVAARMAAEIRRPSSSMTTDSTPPHLPVSPSATNWRLYLELLTLTMFVIPFGHVLGPLVLWLVKKDTIPEVDAEGKKVLNFNLSWTLWIIASCGLGVA